MGQILPLFVYFRSFHMTNMAQMLNDKSVDGVLGTQTRGGRMPSADESTELCRHSFQYYIIVAILVVYYCFKRTK